MFITQHWSISYDLIRSFLSLLFSAVYMSYKRKAALQNFAVHGSIIVVNQSINQ